MATTVEMRGAGLVAPAERSALGVFGLRVGGAGLAYLSQVLLARLMGATDYGIFATIWVWATIVGHGSLFGLGQAASRFIPLYRARGDLDLARGYLAFGFAAVAASALGIAALGGLALWLGRGWGSDPFVWPIAAALLVLPFFAAQDYLDEVARSFGWPGLAIAPPYVGRPALIVVFMVGAVAAGAPAEPAVALLCTLGATVSTLLVQAVVLRARLRRALPPGPKAYRPADWGATALPIALNDLTVMGLASVDVILLGLFLPPEAVGAYFAATRLLQFVVFIPFAASSVTAQRFAEAHARGDAAGLQALVARTARLTTAATLLVGFALVAAAPLLLGLLGPGFGASLPVLAILVAGVVIQAALGPAGDLLTMLGAERLCAAVSLACLAAAVALNLLLIPVLGPEGAAIAMAVTVAGRGGALAVAARLRLGLATPVLTRGPP